jgi:hypothetical protein
LAALVAFTNGNLQNDYLYRVAVPGHPELNTMETNLNMGTNNANNATSYATTNNGAVLENTGTSSMMETQNSTGSYYAYTEGTPTAAAHVASGPDGYAYSLDDAGTMFSGMTDADGSAGSFFDSGGQANELINSPNDKEWILATANNSAAQFNITANSGTGFGFWAASTGESGTSKQFDLPTNASIGSGCSPNGAIAASSTGVTLSCVSGAWTANSGFTQSYQIGVSNGERWYNTGSTPMFVSTYCNPTPNSSGYVENITLDVLTPFGVQYAASQGQVAEGGSDANFAAAPSASVMVPAGWSFITSGTNESCTLLVSQ